LGIALQKATCLIDPIHPNLAVSIEGRFLTLAVYFFFPMNYSTRYGYPVMMQISPSSRHHQLIKYSCHSRPKADPGAWRTVIVAGNIAQNLISVLSLGRCDIFGRIIQISFQQ
jgi:hypothetical protein